MKTHELLPDGTHRTTVMVQVTCEHKFAAGDVVRLTDGEFERSAAHRSQYGRSAYLIRDVKLIRTSNWVYELVAYERAEHHAGAFAKRPHPIHEHVTWADAVLELSPQHAPKQEVTGG